MERTVLQQRSVGAGAKRAGAGGAMRQLRGVSVAAVGLMLASCSTVESINPFSSRPDPFSRAATVPPPGRDQPYPNLADVPARPQPSPAAERRGVTQGLVADRENAQYTDDVFRRTPAAPAPPRAAVPVAPSVAAAPVAMAPVALPPAPPPLAPTASAPPVPILTPADPMPPVAAAPITVTPVAPPPAPAPAPAVEPVRIAEPSRQAPVVDQPVSPSAPAAVQRGSTMDPIPGYLPRRADPAAAPRPVQAAPQPPMTQVPDAPPAPALSASTSASGGAPRYVPPRTLQGDEPGAPPPPPVGLGVPGGAQRMSVPPPVPSRPDGGRLDAMLQAEFPNVPTAPRPAGLPPMPAAPTMSATPAAAVELPPSPTGDRIVLRPPLGLTAPSAGVQTAALMPPRTALAATIYFADRSTSLDEDDRTILREVARLARERGARVRVVGHASAGGRSPDPVARAAANLETSARRADVVAAELTRQGLSGGAIVASADSDAAGGGFGRDEAWARRVEIYLDY